MLLRNLYASQEATELDMEQQTGSKSEKEYVKAVYCHPAYSTSMQSTSWETLGWEKHKQMVIAAMELKDTYSLEGKLWPT